MSASAPAAPKASPGLLCPRYTPSANFPATKRSAVTTAPTATSRQAISASGITLKMAAKRREITASEPTKLTASRSGAESPDGRYRASSSPKADRTALTTSETRRMNASPSTMPIPNTRFRIMLLIPPFSGSGATPHALLSAAWSWPKTPVAPKSRAITLRMAGPAPLPRAGRRWPEWCGPAQPPPAPSPTRSAPRCSPGCPGDP